MSANTEYGIRLTADGSGLIGEARAANEAIKSLGDQHRLVRMEMGTFSTAANDEAAALRGLTGLLSLGAAGLAAYAAAHVLGIKSVIDHEDAVGKLSQTYGIAVEQLSAYSYMAKQANISDQELALGLRNLIKNIDEAAAHKGRGGTIFEALGLDAQGKGLDQVLADVADKFASFKDGPEKAALAMEIFGRSGERLIPFLNKGAAGMAEMRAEAERLGITFGSEAADQAEKFNNSMTLLQAALGATKIAIANDVLPALSAMAERFMDARREGDNFFSSMYQGWHGFFGGSDRNMAEAAIADSTDKLLDLQNRLSEFENVPGSIAAAGRRRLEAEIAQLEGVISRAQALIKVTDPGFFGGATSKTDAPTVPGARGGHDEGQQLLMRLQDQYAQLTGQVSLYDSVHRKMTEGTKEFDPVLRKESEALALKIDAMRKANALAQAGAAQEGDRQRTTGEISQYQAQRDLQYLGMRAGTVRSTEQAGIGAIADPVVRAREQLEAEKRYRDEGVRAISIEEDQKRDLYKHNFDWYVAHQAELNEQLKPQYQKNLEAWSDTNRLMRENWNREMLAMQSAGENFFVQFVTTWKFQIADLARTIQAELARSLYRSGVGSLANIPWWGGAAGASSATDSVLGSGAADLPLVWHAGGIVGESSAPRRRVPAGTFIGAPRLHSGLASDEFPAILQRGETVLARGASAGHTINSTLHIAIDARGADAGTEVKLRSMLHAELPGVLYKHRRALVGLVNDHRIESGSKRI